MATFIRNLKFEHDCSAKNCGTKNPYPYNVQIWTKIEHLPHYFYSGYGKFCKSIKDVVDYVLDAQEAALEPKHIRMDYVTLKRILREYEKMRIHPEPHLIARIVFTKDSFNVPYSLESRTYEFSSDNKVFLPNAHGYSIWASAVDGSDNGVRIEQYMRDEYAKDDGWKVDYCYIVAKE